MSDETTVWTSKPGCAKKQIVNCTMHETTTSYIRIQTSTERKKLSSEQLEAESVENRKKNEWNGQQQIYY